MELSEAVEEASCAIQGLIEVLDESNEATKSMCIFTEIYSDCEKLMQRLPEDAKPGTDGESEPESSAPAEEVQVEVSDDSESASDDEDSSEGDAETQFRGLISALERARGADKEDAAVMIMRVASMGEETARMLRAQGAIPPLIAALADVHDGARERAAGALVNMAADCENCRVIREEGAIPALLTVLEDPCPAARANGAAALGNLAMNSENRIVIREQGGIPILVNALRNCEFDHERTRENAAGVIENLAVNDENRIAVRVAKGIEALLFMLEDKSVSPIARERAVAALKGLSADEDNEFLIKEIGAKIAMGELFPEPAAKTATELLNESQQRQSDLLSEGLLRVKVKVDELEAEQSSQGNDWFSAAKAEMVQTYDPVTLTVTKSNVNCTATIEAKSDAAD